MATRKPRTKPTPDPREELHRNLMRAVVTEPLLSNIRKQPSRDFNIIISLNEQFPAGLRAAHQMVTAVLGLQPDPSDLHPNYVFVKLKGSRILELAAQYRQYITGEDRKKSPIFRVWEDPEIRACLTRSLTTIKADAAHCAFNAKGEGITWAVVDSGIDRTHPHFNGGLVDDTLSRDFVDNKDPFHDEYGHGTHVAGIISGEYRPATPEKVVAVESLIEESKDKDKVETRIDLQPLDHISGVAPKTRLVSLKVLGGTGAGVTSAVLRAIQYIQEINQFGRRLRIHGVNMSIGYDFDPRWFGCGASPLCVEVDRLVKSGVVVVVAAGNTGYSALFRKGQDVNALGYRALSINDPGNADLAITVGATHRDMPHTYGVSYFSSRGPTGDGRLKPDLVAPGERIVSCAAGQFRTSREKQAKSNQVLYLDQSGTSQAAPHVSGAIAAFLSVRREFIGQPEKVKELFLQCAVDLKRERAFQGHGMLDLVKVLQAV